MTIKILKGLLFQWDSNRRVVLDGKDAEATEVHFAFNSDKNSLALITEVRDAGNQRIANIPNSFFEHYGKLLVWTVKDKQTISEKTFTIQQRNRPSDYIYTPTEIKSFEKLEADLKEWVLDQIANTSKELASDYTALKNLPKVNGVELVGDISLEDLGLAICNSDFIKSLD